MSLTFNEIRLAAIAGKTFTLTGVRIRELGIDENGIKIKYLMPNASNYQPNASLDFISIDEQPKYDPCRLFKKGDMVQPRSGKTVLASEYGFVTFHELAGQYEVNEDEARGTVTLIVNGHACFVSAFALELVTPVEELEPYYIEEKDIEFQVRMKCEDKDCLISIFRFENIVKGYKQYHNMLPTITQARERAEAERDRLNAEWRKEQKHD